MKHNEPNNTPPPASTGKAAGAVSRISIEATEAINSHELAGYILALHFPEEEELRRCGRVRPMQWQFESECYRTFWGKLHNRPAPQGRTRTQAQKASV